MSVPAPLRRLIVGLAGLVPQGVKRWLYRRPWLMRPLAGLLKRATSSGDAMIVTVAAGPIAGMKLAVDAGTPNYYWLTDRYEKHLVGFLQQHAPRGATIADIGAHVGYDTLMLCRWVGPIGIVLSFEPDLANFARLQTNIQLNNLTNARPFPLAVSQSTGSARFAGEGLTTSHLLDSPSSDEGVSVPTVSLDDLIYAQNQPAPSLIKLDVEDFEAHVLRGATRLLREARPALLIEIHSPRSLRECVGILRQAGYRIEALGETPQEAAPATAFLAGQPLDESHFERCHLACVPSGAGNM